jgi:predicted outer membrane repeat protein
MYTGISSNQTYNIMYLRCYIENITNNADDDGNGGAIYCESIYIYIYLKFIIDILRWNFLMCDNDKQLHNNQYSNNH